jgi:hypothetical protein
VLMMIRGLHRLSSHIRIFVARDRHQRISTNPALLSEVPTCSRVPSRGEFGVPSSNSNSIQIIRCERVAVCRVCVLCLAVSFADYFDFFPKGAILMTRKSLIMGGGTIP